MAQFAFWSIRIVVSTARLSILLLSLLLLLVIIIIVMMVICERDWVELKTKQLSYFGFLEAVTLKLKLFLAML